MSGRPSQALYKPECPPAHITDSIEFFWNKPYKNEALLRQKYLTESLNPHEIAALFTSSKQTIVGYLRHYNIPLRSIDTRLGPLRYGEKKRRYAVTQNQRQAKALQIIASMRAQNMSYESIASALNSMELPAMKKGATWHGMSVYRLLKRKNIPETTKR